MARTNSRQVGEEDLAALNARATASLPYADDAWDDAVRAATAECATLCESLRSLTSGDTE